MPDLPNPDIPNSDIPNTDNSGSDVKGKQNDKPAEAEKQLTTSLQYLGFDFGEKRIGVAVGQSGTCTANPLVVVRNINGRPEWDVIDALIQEWQPEALIVGLPLTEDGEIQRQTTLAKSFSKHLRRRFKLEVHLCDERYSSNEASRIIADNRKNQNRRRAKHEDTDTVAAALILEQWLNDTKTQ